MMMLFLSALFAAFALTSATPVRRMQPPGPWCDGLGIGSFDVANNFTLAAYNKTLPNENSTGVPLVLGSIGEVGGMEFHVLSTWESRQSNDWPSFYLADGGLMASAIGPTINATSAGATNGSTLTFISDSVLDPPDAVQVYCAIANTDPERPNDILPVLAIYNNPDAFSLCTVTGPDLNQNVVVYNVTSGSASADGYYVDCYDVVLHLVGLY